MADADAINWVSWPLRDEPWAKSALLIAVIALTVFIASFQGPLLGAIALALILVLLGPYFLPCRFEVSPRGVKKFFPLFNRDRPWQTYKRFVTHKDGVFLSTFPAPSRLDSFRGDFLRFAPATDREAVLALVRRHVGPAGLTDPGPSALGGP